jgi:hypothetical protein
MTLMGFRPYDDGQREFTEPDLCVQDAQGDGHQPATGTMTEEFGMDAARAPLDRESVAEPLSDRDRRILEFERQWWKYAGAKEQAIRDLFDMSGTRYYQILNGLIDTPAALQADPMLVKRLRRMRAARQRARSARRLGIDLAAE